MSKTVLILGLFVIAAAILVADAESNAKNEVAGVKQRFRRAANVLSHAEVAGKKGKRGGGGSGESGDASDTATADNSQNGNGKRRGNRGGRQRGTNGTTSE